MPFHRFEGMRSHRFNPHLSSAEGPVLEGEFMYFRMVTKRAGTGAELHYHPNELMAFPLEGKVDCIVGKDRRIMGPGMFVHFPPYARHGFKATEDGDLRYLYIKDRTWTLAGSAADQPLPDKALSPLEVQKALREGRNPAGRNGKSQAIVEGLGNCYYAMIDSLEAPPASGHSERWVEGAHIGFGFIESPPGHGAAEKRSAHELFLYVLSGALDASVAGRKKRVGAGDVIHVPRGAPCRWTVIGKASARYAQVRSLPRLEAAIDKHGAADNWKG